MTFKWEKVDPQRYSAKIKALANIWLICLEYMCYIVLGLQ